MGLKRFFHAGTNKVFRDFLYGEESSAKNAINRFSCD